MPRLVLHLRDRRPVWAIPPWAVAELRTRVPDGWEVMEARTFVDGSGDGGGGPAAEVLEMVRGARAYVGYGVPAEVLEAGAPSLEWVHTATAGVGASLHDAMLEAAVAFTNSAGIHGPPIAETVVGMLLHFIRGLDFALKASHARPRWDPDPFLRADTPVEELGAVTVGILGYGGIGREVARRVRPFGSRVLGLRRGGGRAGPPDGAGAAPEIEGVEVLQGSEGLDRLLRESGALVITAPETPRTRGILSRERIRTLPRGAIVVNVARGGLVDQEALLEALADGHLRGVALDVTEPEPLPDDHPLWHRSDVLVTPHVSGVSRGFWRRELDLVLDNLERLEAGRPLLNRVDPGAGY